MKNGEMQLIINTPSGKHTRADQAPIRSYAVAYGIPLITTLSAARAAVKGLDSLLSQGVDVKPLQDWHASMD